MLKKVRDKKGQTCLDCKEQPPVVLIGYCHSCAEKEAVKIRQRIKISTVIGIGFIVLFVQTNILAVFGLTAHEQTLLTIGAFFASFGGRVRLGEFISDASSYDIDYNPVVGLFFSVIEVILSIISGPFFFLYRPYKLKKLSDCV